MRADYHTYQRATSRALIGAVVQGLMSLAIIVYAAKAKDHQAMTAGLFIGLGVIVWIGLAVVFDQHRRERIEALEAETLTATQGGSVFEGAQGDFKVAAKRLAAMYKFFLPVMSLIFGAGLLAVGWWRYGSGKGLLETTTFQTVTQRGWGVAVSVAVAAVGFTFARYMSGMAKQEAWANLRAGAGQAVGAALFALALVVAHFVDVYGPDAMLRYEQVVFPFVMMVLGCEVFLNFVLDIYRPRKPGEVRTPAFDSRLLSFAAAPDRIAQSLSEAINYQFGYNVSSTWLYQLLARSVTVLVFLAMLVGWLLSTAVVVQPHQRGLVLRFGEYKREIGPGLHWKLPWPIESVEVPVSFARNAKGELVEAGRTVTGIRTFHLATTPPANETDQPILWTNQHATTEVFFIVRPSPITDAAAENLGDKTVDTGLGDMALVAAEVPMSYAVSNLYKFERLGDPTQRDQILTLTARRELLRLMKGYNIDQLLGPERAEIAPKLRIAVQKALDQLNPQPDGTFLGAGVEVLSVGLQGVHPGQQVAPYFEKVVQARQQAAALDEAAKAEAYKQLVETGGDVLDPGLKLRKGDDVAGFDNTKKDDNGETAADRARDKPELMIVERLVRAIARREKTADDTSMAPETKLETMADKQRDIALLLDKCGGKVAALLSEAQAARWTTHMGELAKLNEYRGQLSSYLANEELFRAQHYYDVFKTAVGKGRLYITDDRVKLEGVVNLVETESGSRAFKEESSDTGG